LPLQKYEAKLSGAKKNKFGFRKFCLRKTRKKPDFSRKNGEYGKFI
jgi:hypothetical protein